LSQAVLYQKDDRCVEPNCERLADLIEKREMTRATAIVSPLCLVHGSARAAKRLLRFTLGAR
jgi:hypothetical protein